ncbi:hypothetical protein WP50_29175, partial [Lactiplantibacillus plantarum]
QISRRGNLTLRPSTDVGSNQLVWKLRQDPRVVVMEHTNFRYSKLADFTQGQPNFASIDGRR